MNMNLDETTYLNAARAGDQEAFEQLIDPYRRQLLVHCYRILGSFEDAEDMLQETLVRVWKRLELVRRTLIPARMVIQNCDQCLAGCARQPPCTRTAQRVIRARRPNPAAATTITGSQLGRALPDEWIDDQPNIYPEARYEVRESITLAFIAALQKLPGRQRAVLLLCDVMGWSSNEAAEILDMTTAAVNSALQRARETMKQPRSARPDRHD